VPRSVPAALLLTLLLTASAAEAKSTFTPPLGAEAGSIVSCIVQNLGTKDRSVSVVLHGSDGSSLAAGTYNVLPGQVLSLVGAVGFGNYCEFEGLSRTLRGFVAVTSGNTVLVMLPAAK